MQISDQAALKKAGFTLIELLIVVAIIGIIAAMLIPSFLDSLQKARQKRTMVDERVAGTAMMAWMTDEVGAAAAGYSVEMDSWSGAGWSHEYASVSSLLTPQYVQELPRIDGWKFGFCYAMRTGAPAALNVIAVWSGGQRPKTDPGLGVACDSWPASVVPGESGSYPARTYTNDLLWADGTFIVWPEHGS